MMSYGGCPCDAAARLIWAAACLTLCTLVAGIATIPPAGSTPSVTVPFNASFRTGSDDIPVDDARLAPSLHPDDPEQIHVMYYGPTEVLVSWATGRSQAGPGVQAAPAAEGASWVRYGPSADALTQQAVGWRETYFYMYDFPGAWNYSSPTLHHARLQGLRPLTTYYYQVGDPAGRWSAPLAFTTPPARGDASGPLRIALLADVGQTYNSSDTLGHVAEDGPQIVLHVGDLTYADDYQSNGTLAPWLRHVDAPAPPGAQRPVWGTFQPRWDTWGRLAQRLAAHVPYLVNTGNHELERQSNGQQFGAYTARYPTPHGNSGSSSPLWYSVDVGPLHAVFISSYADFEAGSEQYNWLAADLAAVDRDVTPWILVTFHAPWYNSYAAHFKENECMRLEMEPLLYAYGVDLVFSGHTHAYERSHPVFNHTLDDCGPAYLIIGDGGNVERLAIQFVDEPGACPAADAPQPWEQPQKCVTYQEGLYCPDRQPQTSAFREPSFGHGMLTLLNGTHAWWQWSRNQDPERVVADNVMFVQQEASVCRDRRAAVRATLLHNAAAVAAA